MAYIVTSPDLGQRLTSVPPRQRLLPLMGRELELASGPDTACLSSLTSADAMTMMPRSTVTLHEEGRVGRSIPQVGDVSRDPPSLCRHSKRRIAILQH